MLLIFTVLSNILLLTFANPFHKYPFVFLLDVGNEELENTKADQIRLTVPGGSIALKYPADGDGDTISHVRVSGIDFGTDLKANIIDGGPGSRYVVIMFNGNTGVTYDAVITIQTVPDKIIAQNTEPSLVLEDDESNNNSAEDLGDTDQSKANSDLSEQTSLDDNSVEIDDKGETDNQNQNQKQENNYEESTNDVSKKQSSNQDYTEQDEPLNVNQMPKAEPYSSYDDDEEPIEPRGYVDKSLYDKFQALQPHLYNDVKVYPEQNDPHFQEASDVAQEDPIELDQMFNDEEVHNDAQRYIKINKNYDTDDSNAVAY